MPAEGANAIEELTFGFEGVHTALGKYYFFQRFSYISFFFHFIFFLLPHSTDQQLSKAIETKEILKRKLKKTITFINLVKRMKLSTEEAEKVFSNAHDTDASTDQPSPGTDS